MNTLNHNKQQIGSFSGYASVFNIKDAYNDCILPKAFAKSLFYNNKIDLLWEHDAKKIIGIVKAKEDQRGLYVDGRIFLNLPYAKNAYELVNSMKINHMSIGYQAKDYYKKNNTRYIREILLHEISFVSNPANNSAKIYKSI